MFRGYCEYRDIYILNDVHSSKKLKNECNSAHNYNLKQNSLHVNNVLDIIRDAFVNN